MIQNHKKNTFLMKNTCYPAKMSLELTICQKNGEKKIFFSRISSSKTYDLMNAVTKRTKPQ